LKGKQLFVCRRDYAVFVDIETVIPEKDFDENPAEAATMKSSQKKDSILEQIHKDEILARSMSYDHGKTSGEILLCFYVPVLLFGISGSWEGAVLKWCGVSALSVLGTCGVE